MDKEDAHYANNWHFVLLPFVCIPMNYFLTTTSSSLSIKITLIIMVI